MVATFVALDVETTGLDPEQDRVTEVGAVRFDAGGRVLDRFEALVNPGRPIPLFIQQLTGITDETVRDAPALVEVADALRRFVGEGPVVGHNLGFDVGFLMREGVHLGAPGIDTAELSRILMPDRQPRGLMELAAALGVDGLEHHRAAADAETAARVFARLLAVAEEIPRELRYQLARLVGMQDLVLADLIAGHGWQDLPPAERAMPAIRPVPAMPALERQDPPLPVPPEQVAAALAAGSVALADFEPRAEQSEMAEAVRRAFAENGHWLIEAGTGVGKSLAYLVPAALHALRNGERVVISTNTIALQEQLLRHDIPALRRMLVQAGAVSEEGDLRVSVLKGRSNYLCVRRWTASFAANLADPDFARLAASVLLWLPQTTTGDRSELSLGQAEWLAWPRYSALDADCLARPNVYVKEGNCFLQRARKAAESAHLVIVNHALLLADIASGGSALPGFDLLVVDEAHNLEDQATQQFGGVVSRRLIAEALDGLHRPPARDQREGGAATLLRALPEGAASMAGDDIIQSVRTAREGIGPCLEAVSRLLPPRGEDDRLLITRAVQARPEWTDAETAWEAFDRALGAVVRAADNAARIIRETALVEEPDALAGEIESGARRVAELRNLHARLMQPSEDATIVWASKDRDGLATLNSAPLQVGPTLWEELFSRKRTVVATSATLATAEGMDFAAERMGLEQPRTLQLGSPFDYKASTLLAAVNDLPEPNDPGYGDASARVIEELALAAGGRTLALFTSHSALQRAAQAIRPRLEEAGLSVLAQGIDGTPRQLTENLIENPRSVILGTASFWEGVDIRGEALSLLVVARLPFAVPTDPVHRARSEQYEDPFGRYSLPSAVLRFRQGFGRLIRHRSDRGVVAVLDRRVFEKGYGRDFVAALPQCTMVRADTATVAAEVADWLAP